MVTYTALVNELLELVSQHPKFEVWRQQGKITRDEVKSILRPLKQNSVYAALPGRFFTSAELMVTYAFKSWLALQKHRHHQMVGKLRWLQVIEADLQAMPTSDLSLEVVQARAQQVLEHAEQSTDTQQGRSSFLSRKGKRRGNPLMGFLLDAYEAASDELERRAICYLLRNDLKVVEEDENPEVIQFRIDRKRIEVERLQDQLQSRLPKGRDPTDERYLEALGAAIALPDVDLSPIDEEDWSQWKAQKQLPLLNPLPYPILWGSSSDLRWSIIANSEADGQPSKRRKSSKRPKEKIQVQFNGLGKHTMSIQCDRRQLPVFKQFAEDYITHESTAEEDKFGMSLFALRSACLVWKKDPQAAVKRRKHKQKAKAQLDKITDYDAPWQTHRLYLHCTVDTRLITKEGSEQVRREKASRAEKLVAASVGKELTKTQQKNLKSNKTSVERLRRQPPERPSANLYHGNPDIVVGISLSRHEPVTAVVLDRSTDRALACQRTKALLKVRSIKKTYPNRSLLQRQKEQCRLVNRWRSQRRYNLSQRPEDQKHDNYRQQDAESALGDYLDRLLAARVIQLAQKWQAGSIVLPSLGNIREIVESSVQAEAERRYPKHKELQDKYAKQYRLEFHRWSYGRLLKYLKECARQHGLTIRQERQPKQGSEQEKALALIASAFL
ncbi:hypothetical protein C8B47_03460 [filamentous cyanobacterium CCP4]|nr:hypothetical protein C8B47_03460 [filamentous cyanobacterium CCP4]